MVEIEAGRTEEDDQKMYWGTWEELVLGGAVLRHGTRHWDAVATELRSRTFYPFFFTPQVCKRKYQQLQKRYFGCSGWFEELRKQRVAELKRELEKSQGSIGSLESKLESLKSEKNEENNNSSYPSGNTESPPSVGNVARTDFPSIKDGLSATEETQTDSSPPAAVLAEFKTEEGENATSKEYILKKRRGKRKRKECNDRSFPTIIGKQEFRGDPCSDRVEKEHVGNHCNNRVEEENVDLMSILNSIVESENLSVFQKRTDSQRRGRYKKTIRRHMDLSMMRSQISDGTITSAKELYRDLLLLCNNAIFFYSKESRECKAALSLRDFVTRSFWKNIRVSHKDSDGCSTVPPPEKTADGQKVKMPTCSAQNGPNVVVDADIPADGLKVKKTTNSARNGLKVAVKADKPADGPKVKKGTISVQQDGPKVAVKADKEINREGKNGCEAKVPKESTKGVGKKKVDRPVKVGRTGGSKRVETPVSGRKRPRKR